MTDREIETLIGRAAAKTRRNAWNRSSRVVKENLTTGNLEGRARFMVDEEGNQLFNVQGYGQMSIADIINNKLISAETEILTDSGNNIWGKISEQMAKAGKKFNLESLPIKLLKGNNWFGLVHIYKHLSDFPNQDLSRLMGLVFGDIDKIYARNDAGHIKLEIFPPKARYWGILELRRQDGYYSVVSFYTRKQQNEYPKGEKIWVRSPQSATSQATSDQSNLNDTSGKMLQEPQTELTAQTIDNINPLQIDVKSNSEKNTRFAVAPEETEWEKAVISVLRPVVGESVELSKEEIAAKVKELYGLDLSPDDANLYAHLAAAENRHDNASRQIAANKKRAFEYFEDLHSYFYFFRQSGENMVINPGKEYEGQEVSGSFIPEKFRKYSVITQLDDTGIAPSHYRKKAQLQQELRCILQSLVPTDEGIIFWQED